LNATGEEVNDTMTMAMTMMTMKDESGCVAAAKNCESEE
jgi:hypothetical protein